MLLVLSGSMPLLAFAFNALHWREALQRVQDQRAQNVEVAQMLPSYRAAIRSCGEVGKWSKALTILKQLGDDGGPPDSSCYAEAMRACRHAGQWTVEHELLD
jgi:pentatricopeptide repeat protein